MPEPGIHPTAQIGGDPEWRDFKDGDHKEAPYISPEARVNAFVTVDAGVHQPTYIGSRVFLMAHVHIGHDAVVDQGCELAPGVVIGGGVKLGERVKVGMNATVLPKIQIGDRAVIGAGAVVTKDVEAGDTVVGNPARSLAARQLANL